MVITYLKIKRCLNIFSVLLLKKLRIFIHIVDSQIYPADSVSATQRESYKVRQLQCESYTVWQLHSVIATHCDSYTVWQLKFVTATQCDSYTVRDLHVMTAKECDIYTG